MTMIGFISTAQAQDLNNVLSDLTPAQKAELVLKAEELKKAAQDEALKKAKETAVAVAATTPSDLEAYAELGQKYGIAITSVARELGKSIDEIMATDVGRIALFLIIWKVLGDTILSIGFGTVWFSVMLPFWYYIFNRLVLKSNPETIKYDAAGKITERSRAKFMWTEENGAVAAIMLFVLFLIVISGFVILF